jgi:hypothetical protein
LSAFFAALLVAELFAIHGARFDARPDEMAERLQLTLFAV